MTAPAGTLVEVMPMTWRDNPAHPDCPDYVPDVEELGLQPADAAVVARVAGTVDEAECASCRAPVGFVIVEYEWGGGSTPWVSLAVRGDEVVCEDCAGPATARECKACGADPGEECRPLCLGLAAHLDGLNS